MSLLPTNAEIAEYLHVGIQTVKSHVSSILRKLDLRDRTHAVAYAHLSGFAEKGSVRRWE
ncbi:response regulator transcription factor [Streptomyces chartreusis]|uniref:response regulator transcription factor n=1 Tax=Streptomyces chartreusis TaxID=1969 RepID=UPI0036A5C51B